MMEKILSEIFGQRDMTDYLGIAAAAGHAAKAAQKSGDFDEAWRQYQIQKMNYMQHARRYGHTQQQTVALDASVHPDMANLLRLEGRHADALVDILYAAIAGGRRTKSLDSKIPAYFKRCKFKNTSLDDVYAFIEAKRWNTSYQTIQRAVKAWQKAG